jgi:hypothetical protein
MSVDPSLKVTVPVTAPPATGLTTASIVTDCPARLGLGVLVSEVVDESAKECVVVSAKAANATAQPSNARPQPYHPSIFEVPCPKTKSNGPAQLLNKEGVAHKG